jgi:hypothetical protein
MYSDEAIRKAHLEDFIKVYDRVKKDPSTTNYRLKVLEELIKRCQD